MKFPCSEPSGRGISFCPKGENKEVISVMMIITSISVQIFFRLESAGGIPRQPKNGKTEEIKRDCLHMTD